MLNPFQTSMNVRRTVTAAVQRPLVTTFLTVTTAPVKQVTPVMALLAQVITVV